MPCSEFRPKTFAGARYLPLLAATIGLLAILTTSSQPVAAVAFQLVETPAPVTDVGIKRQIGEPAEAARSGDHLIRITEEVSAKLRCPVCQGMSVVDSPSASAVAMKNEISELLRQGYSETQVKNYFESTYGEFVLLEPKREGLNWLLWLAPGGAFFGGLLWIVVWNKRRSRHTAEPEDLDPYLERVRAHLDSAGTTPLSEPASPANAPSPSSAD